MYVIIVYDVAQERVAKVCKKLRRRLTWVQNSVFEGEISEADFKKIQADLSEVIESDTDSVLFYCIHNPRGWEKRVMGQERASTGTIL
jgi:CRISPR-associated protein Cas2